jgi:hypothetical protein
MKQAPDFLAVFEAELRSTKSVESAVSAVARSAQARVAFEDDRSKRRGPSPRAPLSEEQARWLVETGARSYSMRGCDVPVGSTSAHWDARSVICGSMSALGMSQRSIAKFVHMSQVGVMKAIRRARRADLADAVVRVLGAYRAEFTDGPIEIRIRGQRTAGKAA